MEQIDEPVVHRFATPHETHSTKINVSLPVCFTKQVGKLFIEAGTSSDRQMASPAWLCLHKHLTVRQMPRCQRSVARCISPILFSLQWSTSDKIKMATHYNTIYLLKISVISTYFSAHRRLYPPHPTTQQPVLVGHGTGTTCTSTRTTLLVLTTRTGTCTRYQVPGTGMLNTEY